MVLALAKAQGKGVIRREICLASIEAQGSGGRWGNRGIPIFPLVTGAKLKLRVGRVVGEGG